MQRPDERKRQQISATAARMFATLPFHKVRLDDIAAEAGVGKGTLYIYFESKEELYFSLVYQGFAELVDRLEAQPTGARNGEAAGARQALRRIVDELVAFAFANPQLFEIMRTVGAGKGRTANAWKAKRLELHGLIEQALVNGIASGDFRDARPELTAACIPGMVRSIMLFGPKDVDERTVCEHIMRILETGIVRGATR